MEVGKQGQIRAEKTELGLLRFLDLDDYVGAAPNLCGLFEQCSAGFEIFGVVNARPQACSGLDEHVVAIFDESVRSRWGQCDPVLVDLGFANDSDFHLVTSTRVSLAS